ncbi:MAG TPA: DNA (cytosine-5-)-methyltransferase [Gammaproteobacteria bacterium]|nr:DNA (cytosine-5-)-methyltransferase [Gammaproteobacteria bacterium]
MTRDLLIRDLAPEDVAWIGEAKPLGVSQNEFLRDIVRQARVGSVQPSLFDAALPPKIVHGHVPFKFIDLFAGIGGFRAALTAVGGECVFTSEWDKYAVKTYRAWFAEDDLYTGDIRELDPAREIPDHDVLCAGFPCQPFSLAGVSKKNSLGRVHGFDDVDQGNLFFSIMNVVDAKRPPVLLLENVKNLRSHDKGNTWNVIRQSIEERDYVVFDKVIDARAWVPQHRERIFIVCFDAGVFGSADRVEFAWPDDSVGSSPRLQSVLDTEAPDRRYMLSDKLWRYLRDYAAKHKARGNGFGYSCFGPDDVARTLSARYYKDGSEILIRQPGWKNPRRLTPAEAMKLMGFDNKYARLFGHEGGFPQVVSDTQAYRQFGNAVVPHVVEAVGRKVVECMADVFRRTSSGCLLKGRQLAAV